MYSSFDNSIKFVTKQGPTVSSTKLPTILCNKFMILLFTSSGFPTVCGHQVEPCTKSCYLNFAIKSPKMSQKLGDSIYITSNCICLGHTMQAHNFFAKQFNYFASIKNLMSQSEAVHFRESIGNEKKRIFTSSCLRQSQVTIPIDVNPRPNKIHIENIAAIWVVQESVYLIQHCLL